MISKGEIFQIIKKEEFDKYFFNIKFDDTDMDLILIKPLKNSLKWHDNWIFGLIKSIFKVDNKVLPPSDFIYVGGNIAILLENSHDFKIGGVVEISVNINKLGE